LNQKPKFSNKKQVQNVDIAQKDLSIAETRRAYKRRSYDNN